MRTFEQLHGKGRELDMEIARRVFGKSERDYYCPHKLFCGCPALPHYSQRIEEGWKIVDKLISSYIFNLYSPHEYWEGWKAVFLNADLGGEGVYRAEAKTPARAICLAALEAIENE